MGRYIVWNEIVNEAFLNTIKLRKSAYNARLDDLHNHIRMMAFGLSFTRAGELKGDQKAVAIPTRNCHNWPDGKPAR